MIEKLKKHITDLKKFESQDLNEIESLKIKFLGRKGIVNDLFSGFKDVPSDQKKEFGQKINVKLINQINLINDIAQPFSENKFKIDNLKFCI